MRMNNCVLCGKPTLQTQGLRSATVYDHNKADQIDTDEVIKDLQDNDNEIMILEEEIKNRQRQSEFLRENLKRRGIPS